MKKILLVSHFDSVITNEKNILNRSDLRIFSTTSSEEALSIHKTEQVDLIVADLNMPVLNGDELCTSIREDSEFGKVSVILICNNNREEIERCSNCNANTYITRPIDPLVLVEKVGQLIHIPERESYRVLLKVTVSGKHMDSTFFCFSQNISASGILLETEKLLEKGDPIKCSFFIPGSIRIITEGEVVRIIKKPNNIYHYGINFSQLAPESKTAIEAFVSHRSKK